MYCIHCGQKLPDEAKFCFKCGNKIFNEEIVLPENETEKSVSVMNEAEEVKAKQKKLTFKKLPDIETLWTNKKLRYIASGIAAFFVIIIIIILAAVHKVDVRIPDPEVYFGLPLTDKSTDNGVKIYEYKVYNDEDMKEAVDSYVSHLRNDYNFLLTNTNAEKNYIIYKFFSKDNNKAELSVYYNYGSFNEISVRMSRNIGFEADTTLSYKSSSSGKDSSSSNKNSSSKSTVTSASSPTITGVGETESKTKENSSVSSSSSHSTASVNKDLYDVKSRCGVCGGDGDCNTCGGDGKLYSSASKKEDRNCYKCSGRGNCRTCGGDGWVGED